MGALSMTTGFLLWLLLAVSPGTVHAACNADNCLRAFFPSTNPYVYSADYSFCASFTSTVNTKTTGFPTRATAACGTMPARYSSACSCRPTAPSTTTGPTNPSNNIVQNGGFEDGLAPWVAKDLANTSHTLVTPGDNSNFAYKFFSTGPSYDAGPHPANVSQNLTLTVGRSYTLTFRAYFENCDGTAQGFIGVKVGGDNGVTYSVVCGDYGPPYQYVDNTFHFTAVSNPENLRFDFPFDPEGSVAAIDNVVVTPR